MKNILLIEDEDNLNRGISLKLQKEGYTVFSAATVAEGLSLFQANTIDLVICDIGLPDGSGLDLCASIRQKSDVLFLFLTALDTEVASDADEKMEFLKRSEAQLEKLEQLIASLMNISRLETAMISLTKEPILLSDLLVDAVNGVYEKARRKNIEISLQKTENIALQLDKHWTTEAVINVLDNAVKYSPQNSHITISIEKQHFYTLVKITDEGIGISQSEYNKIFQRFYRSNHSYVKKTEGSGVGLYLTRMILERQGGLIRVESVPEKGSTFILQFRN